MHLRGAPAAADVDAVDHLLQQAPAAVADGLNFAAHDTYTQDTNLVNQGVDYAASGLGARTDVPLPSPFPPAPAGPVTPAAPAP